jgi:predicted RNase H-like HicB family nuclease
VKITRDTNQESGGGSRRKGTKQFLRKIMFALSAQNDSMFKKTLRMSGGRRFTVVLQSEEVGGYSVKCVELPQAISQGETREEALANIKEAIELVLEHLEEKTFVL